MHPQSKPENADARWLIESDPRLNAVTIELEAGICVCFEICHKERGEHAPVLVLKSLWEIPMIECADRLNAVREEAVYELVVEGDTLLVRGRDISSGEKPGPRQ